MNHNQLSSAPRQSQLPIDLPIELIRTQKNSGAAFSLACTASGLDDKDIYLALPPGPNAKPGATSMDAGYFSNMKKGKATLQGDLLAAFCAVVGNTIYPEWLAYQVGCTLVMIQSEAERRAEKAERRADAAENQVELLTKVLQGRAIGSNQ